MKVLLIGRWGKTHALAKALAESPNIELYSLIDKNNTGIAEVSRLTQIADISSIPVIEEIVEKRKIELIVMVPEMPCELGAADYFRNKGVLTVGPSELCTKLETDKGFARNLMKDNNIKGYPDFKIFLNKETAVGFIEKYPKQFAVKPSGVTSGDGVKVIGIQLEDKLDAIDYVKEIFDNEIGGIPRVIIEEKIEGEEYTIQMFSDGKTIVPTPAVKDYKLLNEGDSGLNTPGMGSCSYSDHLLPFLSRRDYETSVKMIEEILDVLKEKYNEKFKGILSGQFMLTDDGIKLIEINVRPGDSEILNLTPILKTDFLEICLAIAEERLDEMDIVFENKATVCKYVVPKGFPTPIGNFKVKIDKKRIDEIGVHLFQSCFEVGEHLYEPSPRLFAITGVGNSLKEAYEKCEEGISCIHGNEIFYRKDIGSQELSGEPEEFDSLMD